MIDYSGILQEKVEIKNALAMQLMLGQVLSYQELELDIFQLLNNAASIPVKIISKIETVLT